MNFLQHLGQQRAAALESTKLGPPQRTLNQFFGVGPITDGAVDEVDARFTRFEFRAGPANLHSSLSEVSA